MAAAPVATGGGRFVILVGPDGVGKTTVARAMIDQHRGTGGIFSLSATTLRPFAACSRTDPRRRRRRPRPAARVCSAGSASSEMRSRCWVGYLNTVRPALKRSWLVVGDRWMYGYLVQPDALKFRGPDRLARAVLRLLPRPDLIVNLSAPPHVIGSASRN